jgi:hypothetical protein
MQISKSRTLTSKEYALIEELVTWGSKIKDINWIIGIPKTELYAKNYYKKMGQRPPNGLPGSATAKTVRLEKKMQYFALAVRYKNLLAEGIDRNEAMLSVYRLHWSEYGYDEIQKVKPSTWFSTSKRIDCGLEHIVSCTTCGGQYILSVDAFQDPKDRCVWCNHILSKHIFRKAIKNYVLLKK